jgi:hypothetical protein
MTLRDLLEKGEGQLYLVSKSNPTSVTEMDCVMKTFDDFHGQFSNYAYYLNYDYNRIIHSREYVIARKSRAKNNVNRNGVPRLVNITNNSFFVYPTQRDLDNTSYDLYSSILFLSKEEACNYVIEKIKKQKQALNAIIVKVNKYKFSVAE